MLWRQFVLDDSIEMLEHSLKKLAVCLNSSSGIELATSDANVSTELDVFSKLK